MKVFHEGPLTAMGANPERGHEEWLGVGCGKTPTNGQCATVQGPHAEGRATRRSAEEASKVGRRLLAPRCEPSTTNKSEAP